MKLLFILSHLRRGGPVDVVYNLCKLLLSMEEMDISVLTLRKETENSRKTDFAGLGTPIYELGLSYITCEINYSTEKRIQRIVDEKRINIIHCHGYHSVLAGSRIQNVKKIATLHNRATEDFVNVFGNIYGRYMLWRYFRSLNSFDLNIAVAKSAADLYAHYVHRVCYVNNGIDTNVFSCHGGIPVHALRKQFGLPVSSKIIVSTGRIEKEKRYVELIQWYLSNVSNTDTVLLIIGDGSQLEKCRQVARNSDRVYFTGRVSNVADYLKCADYYISNSKSEGMSMAVCEAISCGLFPFLSDIPSHRDVAEAIGGIFFEDISNMSVNDMIRNSYDRVALHNHILTNFSMESMVKGYYEYYRKILC